MKTKTELPFTVTVTTEPDGTIKVNDVPDDWVFVVDRSDVGVYMIMYAPKDFYETTKIEIKTY